MDGNRIGNCEQSGNKTYWKQNDQCAHGENQQF